MKLLSWAEPGNGACSTDLEGSAPPARFALRYVEAGQAPVRIENDPEQLFASGWSVVNRSERGYGFEKVGRFERFEADVLEELQCRCPDGWERNPQVAVKIEWTGSGRLSVRGSFRDGPEARNVEPVAISGRLVLYEFRFARPFPTGGGECASRFLAALELPEPIDSNGTSE